VRRFLAARQPRDLLGVFAQFSQVAHLVGQLGLDHPQVAAAPSGLPDYLLNVVGGLCLRPVACRLVDQHRHAAGARKDGVGGCPRRLLALVEAEDLGHLVLTERA
jgi:hypothetical protein